jgi:fatty-acyl-CoA synthase
MNPGCPPLPTTAEIIEARALGEPGRAALREGDRELTYAQLHATLSRCASALHGAGVRPGHRVAVAGPGFLLQWVVLLAAEGLGAVTASFLAEQDADAPGLFAQVDWVLAARPQAVPPGVRFVLLDDAFVQGWTQAHPPVERHWRAPEMDAPHRITRTSGSTGQAKFMVLSRRAQEYWVGGALSAPLGPETRLLMLAPLVMNGAFSRGSRCLRRGGLLMTASGAHIAALAPTDVWGLPLHLERLLDELPPGYRAGRVVNVVSIGGNPPPALRARLQEVFPGRMLNGYGSNEVGRICYDLDGDGTGVLCPGVDVRILASDGQELPPGSFGAIVVRTPSMADGYVGAPEESAAAFRDGWFHTSDTGALLAPRILRLAGRHDELLVVGGIKVPARTVEAGLCQQASVADCAALAIHLQGGAVTLGLAVVLAPGATQDQALAEISSALQLRAHTGARVIFVAQLPVLQSGKVDRVALQRELQSEKRMAS